MSDGGARMRVLSVACAFLMFSMAVTAQALAGKSASEARSESNDAGEDATTQAQRSVKLDNFDQSN